MNPALIIFLSKLMSFDLYISEEINNIIEKRAKKVIGSSLEAELLIKLNSKNQKIVEGIDLSELCITSLAKVENSDKEEVVIETTKAKGEKCPVCWKISTSPCVRHHNK